MAVSPSAVILDFLAELKDTKWIVDQLIGWVMVLLLLVLQMSNNIQHNLIFAHQ